MAWCRVTEVCLHCFTWGENHRAEHAPALMQFSRVPGQRIRFALLGTARSDRLWMNWKAMERWVMRNH